MMCVGRWGLGCGIALQMIVALARCPQIHAFSSVSMSSFEHQDKAISTQKGLSTLHHAPSHKALHPQRILQGQFRMATHAVPWSLEEPLSIHSNSKTLLTVAITSYFLLVLIAPTSLGDLLARGIIAPFASNVPMSIACFGGADVATQVITGVEFSTKRVLTASAVGVLCNSVGLVVWLHWLDAIIPKTCIGFAGMQTFTNLLVKSFAHSLVWGTISNSISIFLRRLLSGESVHDAIAFWDEKIMPVMQKQFWFWPAYQGLTFALVPSQHQIAATAMGAFAFNIYMSLMAASSSKDEPKASNKHYTASKKQYVAAKKKSRRPAYM